MRLLAFDTSTEMCSVALLDGEQVQVREKLAPRRHAEWLLPWCQALLDEAGVSLAQLDGIGFGRGPGAFTGVRIAVSAAQGMALAADLPCVPVSSLAATAQAALDDLTPSVDTVLAAFDARMDEVYWGIYRSDQGSLIAQTRDQLSAPEQVSALDPESVLGVGPAFAAYGQSLGDGLATQLHGVQAQRWPGAAALARLAAVELSAGGGVSALQAQPVYLRDQVTNR